ncbi:MAG: hypothetical protein LBK61_08110 [Spirochaetaceae bacterium]|jgi:hypothetical protein|nr:hypothetical protein [Spirochaetaceae bacterium]
MILVIWRFSLAVLFVVVNGAMRLVCAQSQGCKLKPTGLLSRIVDFSGIMMISGAVVIVSWVFSRDVVCPISFLGEARDRGGLKRFKSRFAFGAMMGGWGLPV